MRVTTKGRYALLAVTNLALWAKESPKPIKKIAAEEQVSPEFLEQILHKLRKANLVRSVRGPGGGFQLAAAPSEISVRDVFEAVGEGFWLAPCTTEEEKNCERIDTCLVHDMWLEATEFVKDYFGRMTLQRIMESNSEKLYRKLTSGEDVDMQSAFGS